MTVEEIWAAQEQAYKQIMQEDDQYCHETSFRWGFEQGVDWTTKVLMDKVVSWLFTHSMDYLEFGQAGFGANFDYPKMIEDLKKAIKDE